MPTVEIQKPKLKNYETLRNQVRERIALGRARMEEERVTTYHEVGTMIVEHLKLNTDTPTYGKRIVQNLSEDLGISSSLLYDIVKFARAYPIFPARGKSLTWTDYRKLISIQDPEQRKKLETRILKEDLSTREIEGKVRKTSLQKSKQNSLLKPLVGKLGTYQIVSGSDAGFPNSKELFFDHGFRMYRKLSDKEAEGLKAGAIVTLDSKRGQVLKPVPFLDKDRFFYQATVEKVVDGDTLWTAIDIGFQEISRQKLRLRGVDAPELLEKGGSEAFRFLKSVLLPGTSILLHTSAFPNHDRFVADVYIKKKGLQGMKGGNKGLRGLKGVETGLLFLPLLTPFNPSSTPFIPSEYIFINNLILALKLANRFEE